MAVRKWPVFLLVLLAILVPAISVSAETVQVKRTDQLLRLLRQAVAQEYQIPPHDVLIIWNDQDLEAKLSKWGKGLAIEVTDQDLKRLVQRSSLLLKVVQGSEYKGRVPIKVTVDGWMDVYESSRLIRKGEVLSPESLETKRIKLSDLPAQYVRAPFRMEDFLARQDIPPKTVLGPTYIQERPLVERGQKIKIILINQNLRLVAQGEALESGARNALIWVKILNFDSAEKIHARVSGEGEVTLKIDA